MSSSSSAAEGRVAPLLAQSFEVLAREQPEAYVQMCALLDGLAIAVGVDAERFSVAFELRHAHVRAVTGQEQVRVMTRGHTLLDVLNSRQSLAQAVLADAVEVIGHLETLLRVYEGLLLYVHGAVRSPGFAPLLRRLLYAGISAT